MSVTVDPQATEKEAALKLLRALDRCAHGRHRADNCFECPDRRSTGNLFLEEGQQIGTTLYGERIIVPPMERRGDPHAWTVSGRAC